MQVLAKYMRERGGSVEEHYQYAVRYLNPVPRVEPAAVETVLRMVGQSGAPAVKIYDNSIMDRVAQEGSVERINK
jgi:hypothetical protein